jgi:hypothetical protein
LPRHFPGDDPNVHDLSCERSERKDYVTANLNKSMLILVAGPYRSGTNDDPALMKKNVQYVESYALSIFRAGHTPIIGEWLALPLVI